MPPGCPLERPRSDAGHFSLLHRTAGELEHPPCRDCVVEKASPAVAISLNHRLNYCFSQTFKRLPSTDSDAVQECRQTSEANKPDNRMNFARRSDRVLWSAFVPVNGVNLQRGVRHERSRTTLSRIELRFAVACAGLGLTAAY